MLTLGTYSALLLESPMCRKSELIFIGKLSMDGIERIAIEISTVEADIVPGSKTIAITTKLHDYLLYL